MRKRKVLFLVTEGEYFSSHRLPLALQALRQGYEVALAANVTDKTCIALQQHGIVMFAVPFIRASLNPWHELKVLARIFRIYRQWRPDIVHQVAFKPAIYGTLAARILKVPRIINAIAGLGIVFISQSLKAKILRSLILGAFSRLMRHPACYLITQTSEDAAIVGCGLAADKVKIIPGVGINTTVFTPAQRITKRDRCQVIMISRLLWSKGVGELVQAASIIKEVGLPIDIILVGEPDLANPDHVPIQQLQEWHNQGLISWIGRRTDVAKLYQQADVAVFPSYYGEGVPKTLLEAAACGKPIVTTDHPGCRDVVAHGENGLLVPPRDVNALVAALRLLHNDQALCQAMGQASRQRAVTLFAEDNITQATVKLYKL